MTNETRAALLEDAEEHNAQLMAILIRVKELMERGQELASELETEMHRSRGIAAVVRDDGEPR